MKEIKLGKVKFKEVMDPDKGFIKICPVCGFKIEPSMKFSYEKEWCPVCSLNYQFVNEKKKELHIWMGEDYKGKVSLSICKTFQATQTALNNGIERIDTLQPHFCNTKWLQGGYRIFVHMLDRETVEIKFGEVSNTNREIKPGHNLEKLLLVNEFGKAAEVNSPHLKK